MKCDELRELAPDTALGIADGEERAAVLGHIEGCAECRQLLDRLSEVTDELLLLAPEHEPPVGFESRVLKRLGAVAPRRRRWRLIALRIASAVIAAAIAVAITTAVLSAAYSDEREIAAGYLKTLERADGEYFGARELLDRSGAEAGIVFGYEGSPSWVLVVVDATHRDRISAAKVTASGGRTVALPAFWLDRAHGSWGGAIPIDLHEVKSVSLLGDRAADALTSSDG